MVGKEVDVVVRTADWIRSAQQQVSPVVRHEDAERLALLAVLASELERCSHLTSPQDAVFSRLSTDLADLPPQIVTADESSSFGRWFRLAALAEHLGAARLAQLMIDRLIELTTHTHTVAGRTPSSADIAERQERLALCWARRGRLSRIAGTLNDAEECYRCAARLAAPLPWRDAKPQAELGMAALATVRGNWPAVIRRLKRLLGHRPPAADVYRLPAHQMLAVAMRKRKQLVDALLHAWEAFDLLGQADFRRFELIVGIAEIATDLGDWDAAAHGFDAVLAAPIRVRIRTPALIGALRVWTMRPAKTGEQATGERLAGYMAELEAELPRITAPSDAAEALLALADIALQMDRLDDANRWLLAAAEVSDRVGLFELQFRVVELGAALTRRRASAVSIEGRPRDGAPPGESLRIHRRHPALARLAATTFR